VFPVVLLLALVPGWLHAAPVQVQAARAWAAPDSTRVVLDTDAPAEHRVSVLHDPERVVVDIPNVALRTSLDALTVSGVVYDRVRSAMHDGDTLRVVFDLNTRVRPKSFVLKPNERYGHRLVIDLFREGAAEVGPSEKSPTAKVADGRDVIVAIDAGHGGEDSGAIGPGGTMEKDIVLAIAERLRAKVEREPGMKPLMIRNSDYFVSLNGRRRLAQQQRADLFVSIHADSTGRNPKARGASVYALSTRGASSEAARVLADSENATDLIGGVNLEDKDDVLTSVLLDLSQSGTIEASLDLGNRVINELGKVGSVHKARVEQAGFVVLKSLGIPSILVESGFISNRTEESKLRDPMYQELIANSVMRGVRSYFADHAPPDTLLAATNVQHVIQPGETLAVIAQRYQVSVIALRTLNEISGDLLQVGQVLRIPRALDVLAP
jgi:N-acetylmuramoyl-L-alanine amidase